MMTVNAELEPLKSQLKGEKLFLATEKIYQKHGYHPIKSIGMGASFFVMLPVLISAIVLFTADGVLDGVGFLIIEDLSKPDALLGAINVLPIVMSAITVADARMRFKDDIKSQYRFYLIALVLLFLVYKLPAGLVIYWTGSNILSLLLFQLQASSAPE
jgi:YidC/Oxa1 family membrane protein insertase